VMSTASGGLYQHYEYGAYGNSRYTSSTTAFPATHRYTSQSFDEETGLYNFGARYYDPVIGRFIQPDTVIPNLFDPQAYDRYAYARDNPFEYVDPNGHAWQIFSTEYWKGLAHRMLIGGNGAPQIDPNSEQALANAEGVGTTQLTDQNGNVISPGAAVIQVGMAVVKAPLDTALILGGEGEAEEGLKAGEEIIQGERAGETAESAAAGKPFTQAQKRAFREANKAKNDGRLVSDESGQELVAPQQSQKGVTPPDNEAQVDHIVPRSKGGQNTPDNHQILSRKENRLKSDTMPPTSQASPSQSSLQPTPTTPTSGP
jgi:RHS repeat-associated protein